MKGAGGSRALHHSFKAPSRAGLCHVMEVRLACVFCVLVTDSFIVVCCFPVKYCNYLQQFWLLMQKNCRTWFACYSV